MPSVLAWQHRIRYAVCCGMHDILDLKLLLLHTTLYPRSPLHITYTVCLQDANYVRPALRGTRFAADLASQ